MTSSSKLPESGTKVGYTLLAGDPLRQELHDVPHIKRVAGSVRGSAHVEDAAGIVGAKHGRAGGAHILQLARHDALSDLRILYRSRSAKAATHGCLRRVHHRQSSPAEEPWTDS